MKPRINKTIAKRVYNNLKNNFKNSSFSVTASDGSKLSIIIKKSFFFESGIDCIIIPDTIDSECLFSYRQKRFIKDVVETVRNSSDYYDCPYIESYKLEIK